MKKIPDKKQKEILIEILKYFDNICRKNNINYSLIGGSLIGAIRHQGIIPWDDDIDVIMAKSDYLKIIELIKKDNDTRFKLLTRDTCKNYFFPFPKLVDTNTYLIEDICLKQPKEYGLFIDIFYYVPIPKDKKEFKKLKLINSLLSRKKLDFKKESFKQNFLRASKNLISILVGYNNLIKIKEKLEKKWKKDGIKYVVPTWPMSTLEHEAHLIDDVREFIDAPFGGIKTMIFKNYDTILKTTFGNYMQLPPKEKRKKHDIKAYWRNKWKRK